MANACKKNNEKQPYKKKHINALIRTQYRSHETNHKSSNREIAINWGTEKTEDDSIKGSFIKINH